MTRARTLSLLGNENNFTVTGSNNVGIGSTLPDGKLDVGGDIVVGTAITISSVSGIISATDFYVNGVSITGAAGTWATFTSGGEGGISTTKKVKIENGLEVTGISTFSGDLTVGGVLTYEDVTNVDSIGIITARSGIRVTGGDSNVVGVSTIVTTTQDDANNHYSLVVRGDDSGVDGESAQFFLGAINSTTRGTVIAAQRKGSSNNHDLIFKTSAVGAVPTERVRITSEGKVGVGTIVPASLMHIHDASASTNVLFQASAGTNNAFFGMRGSSAYKAISANDAYIYQNGQNIAFQADDAASVIKFAAGGNQEQVRISSGGLVGIGTISPTAPLTVSANSASAELALKRANTNTTGAVGAINWQAMDGHSVASMYALGDGDNEGAHIIFATTSAASADNPYTVGEQVRITSSGGVGIGTNDTTGARLIVGSTPPDGSGGLRVINSDSDFSAGHECAFMDYTGSAVRLGHLNGASGSAKKIQFISGGGSKIEIDGGGHLYPSSDNAVNLGFSTARWANIYSADLQLSNEGSSNDVDGTWGQYTIQEGENDLFLLNRRNGKKYKFVLQEVN